MNRLFDRLADVVAEQVSRAWFFAVCVLLVVLWAPSLPLFGSVDTWQLVINTVTTIVTFILVALLHNATHRAERAVHHKLDLLLEAGLAAGIPAEVLANRMREAIGTEASR